ncbi:hypothetical protein, partial [Nitrosomonas sp. ANs5]|uniref:hypothetical protein n=1 Tax=Nitrosomonas sp. ANs5 TaxID=3423941 RepID=UPI003D33DC15
KLGRATPIKIFIMPTSCPSNTNNAMKLGFLHLHVNLEWSAQNWQTQFLSLVANRPGSRITVVRFF